MSKTKIDEKTLLANANRWFEHKHNATPADCDIKFIKIWNQPRGFTKSPTVVFAPTEEIGTAFIKERTLFLHTLIGSLCTLALCIIALCSFIWSIAHGNIERMINIAYVTTFISIVSVPVICYITRKCKKLEKIHKWQVETYET